MSNNKIRRYKMDGFLYYNIKAHERFFGLSLRLLKKKLKFMKSEWMDIELMRVF